MINTRKPLFLLLILGLLSSMTMNAQLKQFTLEDLNYGGKNYRQMSPKSVQTTWWGDQLVHIDREACSLVNKNTGKDTQLFTLDELNQWLGTTTDDTRLKSLSSISFPYAKEPLAFVYSGTDRVLVDFKKKTAVWRQTYKDETHSDWNATSRSVAFVKDHNLCITDAQGNTRVLTTDGSREIVYGQSVHRDEFGIYKGTFWSPDGQKLAFYRMDQSMVSDYPQVDITTRIATHEPDKYPMAGETSHQVTVGVYDTATGKTIYLKAGDPTDRYFTNIAWSPSGKTLYMFELNRDQNDCRLVSYNAETGDKMAELYRETDEKYVEPQHPIQFLPWDHTKFILQSQKDGYNHLYIGEVKNEEGKVKNASPDTPHISLRQLTSGPWVVMDVVGFDTKHKSIVIASNELNPIQRNIFLVDVNSGKRALMDDCGQGWHYASLSSSGQYLCDSYQTPTIPRKVAIVNTANGKRTPYFQADDPWQGYDVPEYSSGTIKAADGTTDLYWRMVKPTGFDPTKKYPTVVYVYGGPHAHNVDARWHYCSRSWETYMAQKGYVLFILDNRGSENRGKDFEQATFRQLGQIEMQDQMKGVEYLKTLPYVDQDRLGVHGWSFGGFMTISLMTTYPDVFKVGVAGGPVIDWKYYEVMYGERYMDTPQSNPEGYAKTSLLSKAKDLKGKLQVIIGMNDATCVPQHSLSFLEACIKAGTQPDFFVYPGEPHNMRGHQSVHLHERITQYFEDYLK